LKEGKELVEGRRKVDLDKLNDSKMRIEQSIKTLKGMERNEGGRSKEGVWKEDLNQK